MVLWTGCLPPAPGYWAGFTSTVFAGLVEVGLVVDAVVGLVGERSAGPLDHPLDAQPAAGPHPNGAALSRSGTGLLGGYDGCLTVRIAQGRQFGQPVELVQLGLQ